MVHGLSSDVGLRNAQNLAAEGLAIVVVVLLAVSTASALGLM